MSKSVRAKAAKAKAPPKKVGVSASNGKGRAAGKAVSHAKAPKFAVTSTTKSGSKATIAAKAVKAKADTIKADTSKTYKGKVRANAPAAPVALATAKAVPEMKSEGLKKKMPARVKIAEIVLPAGYRPAENEPFMNEMHRAYFRKRLLDWKDEILRQTRETLAILHEDSTQHADLADRATSETDRATELRTRDRQRKLIAKIDAAVGRIEDGTYGYCEDTGEPIGLKRLDARPIATLSVEAQERHERRERVYREE